jgi:hypothetical protein
LTYEIELHQCDPLPKEQEEIPVIPKRCFFMTLDGIGSNLALTSKMTDKYAPRTTHVYDVGLSNFEGTGAEDRTQQWWYNDVDHTVHSFAHSDSDGVLFEGFNKNLIVFKNLGRD